MSWEGILKLWLCVDLGLRIRIVVVSTCLENSWSSIWNRVQGRGRVEVLTLYFRPRLDPGEYYGDVSIRNRLMQGPLYLTCSILELWLYKP